MRSTQADIKRVLGRRRQAVAEGRARGASIRCRSAISLDGERGIARSARHGRRAARRRHACGDRRRRAAAQSRALRQPLPSVGRAHGRHALCERALPRWSTTKLEMGAACIDMGGGTTTISVFADGKFVHADAIRGRRQHVTMDLARGLSTRLEDAERLKIDARLGAARQRRRPRRGLRAADRRRRRRRCRSRCRARR